MTRIIAAVLVLVAVGGMAAMADLVCPATVKCPADGYPATYTGNRTLVNGVWMGVFHCPFGTTGNGSGHDITAPCK
jgi:hypothetical protein